MGEDTVFAFCLPRCLWGFCYVWRAKSGIPPRADVKRYQLRSVCRVTGRLAECKTYVVPQKEVFFSSSFRILRVGWSAWVFFAMPIPIQGSPDIDVDRSASHQATEVDHNQPLNPSSQALRSWLEDVILPALRRDLFGDY